MRNLLLLAILLVPATVLGAGHPAEGDNFIIQLLKHRHPNVKWDRKSIKKTDINCDGKDDAAILGKEGEKVVIAVVLGPLDKDSKIILSRLLVGKHSQDSLCTAGARLSIEDQDYDPAEIFGEPVPGFRRSRTCKGINVGDGECDSFHYFWNHESKTIDWWRL